MLFRMIRKIKVSSDWFGCVLFISFHIAKVFSESQVQTSLIEVYEAEIRRLREENHNLRIRHNSMATQLNEVVAQLQQTNAEGLLLKQRITETKNVFYNTKKDFW